MQLHNFFHRRLIGAAVLSCAAALIPAAGLAATTSPAAPAGAGNSAATVPGLRPAWSSFYSPASGVVLGGVGCTGGPACRARLVATTDGGARWHVLTAPDVVFFNGAGNLYDQDSSVSGVVFASARDGWLYGPALYATHDGGARWRRLSLGGAVDTMAVSAGTAYAVVSTPGKGSKLFASPAGRNAWHRVGTLTARNALLAVSGKAAWFAQAGTDAGNTYVWATADGRHWHKYPVRCPGAYYYLNSITAASPADVLFLCIGPSAAGHSHKELLASANGGKTAHLAGFPPIVGVGGVIAVPPRRPGQITLATEYAVDHSANGGKTWKQVLFNSGGASLTSLAFVTKTVGWAVEPEGTNSRLMRTTNAGATWHQVPIPARHARPVTAYVANLDSGTVTPINTATNKAGKPIPVGTDLGVLAITPNGRTVWVFAGTGSVVPINTATGKAGRALNVGALGAEPQDIAITPNGKTVYVIGEGNAVIPISTHADKAGKAITVASPFAIAITPNGKTAYVTSFSQPGTVIPINTATGKAGKAIPAGNYPFAIAITPNGKTAYVANHGSSTVTPINTATNKAGKPITVGAGPYTIAITPNGKTAYVANFWSDTVTPINTATGKAGKAIPVGDQPSAIAITP